MKKMIEIQNLVYEYKKNDGESTKALKGINLEIEQGEFVVVIGHNGSGKSTLAKHINAILLPTEGRVLVKGLDTRDPNNLWEIRQSAGMVFQNPDNQIVATIVEEDVAFDRRILHSKLPNQGEGQSILELVDMKGYATHGPHLLSGGQKQRIACRDYCHETPMYYFG